MDYLVPALLIAGLVFVTLKLFVLPALRQTPKDPNVTIDTIKPHPIVADKITAHTVTVREIAAQAVTAQRIVEEARRNNQLGDTK